MVANFSFAHKNKNNNNKLSNKRSLHKLIKKTPSVIMRMCLRFSGCVGNIKNEQSSAHGRRSLNWMLIFRVVDVSVSVCLADWWVEVLTIII